jgi:hypothetical protein
MDALATLANISGQGGMDAQSQLAFQQALNQSGQAARGARAANLSNAAQRGVAGSGLEFVLNQQADQDAANQAQMAGLSQAAAANNRSLDALRSMADLGGTLTNRDLGLKTRQAEAADAINRFNTENRQNVAQTNMNTFNQAQAANLANRQDIANKNVTARNYAQEKNKSLEQQKFDNNMRRAQGAAGLSGQQAAAAGAQGQAAANLWGGLGQTALGAAGTIYANSQKSDQTDKLLSYLKSQNENKAKQGA